MTVDDARARSAVLAAAPLDAQARLVVVAWLCAAFALVAALMAVSVAGGGTAALAAGLLAGVALPGFVLARVAALPATFEIAPGELVVRRWLGGARAYRLRGPAARERDLAWLRGRRVLLLGAYGCRTIRRARAGDRVHLATTNLRAVLRLDTPEGPLLASPADREAFAAAVREALR